MASQSREKHCAQKTNKARLPVESKSSLEIQRLQPSDGPTGSYSEPEVGFGDIAADLREARFWISSGWPTIRPEYVGWVSFSCSSQLPVAAREVSGDKADKWTGNASLQVLLSSHRAARLSDVSGHLWAMGIYMVPQDSYFQIPPTMVRSTWIFNNSDGSALNGSCASTTRSASRPG